MSDTTTTTTDIPDTMETTAAVEAVTGVEELAAPVTGVEEETPVVTEEELAAPVTGVEEETPVVTEEELAAPVTGVEEETPVVTEEELAAPVTGVEAEAEAEAEDEAEEASVDAEETEGLRHRFRTFQAERAGSDTEDEVEDEETRPLLPIPTSPLVRQVGVAYDTDDEREDLPDRVELLERPPVHAEEGDIVPVPINVLLAVIVGATVYLTIVTYLLSWNCPALMGHYKAPR